MKQHHVILLDSRNDATRHGTDNANTRRISHQIHMDQLRHTKKNARFTHALMRTTIENSSLPFPSSHPPSSPPFSGLPSIEG